MFFPPNANLQAEAVLSLKRNRKRSLVITLLVIVLSGFVLLATESSNVAKAGYSRGWSGYAPPMRIDACTYIEQSGRLYEIWLTPTDGRDIDLYLKRGDGVLLAYSDKGGASREYIRFQPNMSYASGLKVCVRGWDWSGGSYELWMTVS